MRTELVLDALHMAVAARGGDQAVAGVIAHADRASQYTSDNYIGNCQERHNHPSARRGDAKQGFALATGAAVFLYRRFSPRVAYLLTMPSLLAFVVLAAEAASRLLPAWT